MEIDALQAGPFSLKGQHALITGASSGLGWHFASVLAAAGAHVTLVARRAALLEHRAQEIRDTGGEALALPCNVTIPKAIEDAVETAQTKQGPITIVVNNAGVAHEAALHETTDDDWRRVMDVNLDGVFRVARAAASAMQASRTEGSIINIASVLGFGVLPMVGAYAVSKAAVVQLTKAMALELAPHDIRVNALAPGYFKTEINDAFLDSDAGQKLIRRIPQKRCGDLAELDGPLLLLASSAGRYMTGTTITVDGGARLTIG